MATLEDLARVLGGVVQVTRGRRWLDTTIGELRAAVIPRHGPLTVTTEGYDLAVFLPAARELDPLGPLTGGWRIDGRDIPRLRHGYVFADCRAGVLFASSLSAPTLEQTVGTLWDLADWARKPWRPVTSDDAIASQHSERRRNRRRWLEPLGSAAMVIAVVVLARRLR